MDLSNVYFLYRLHPHGDDAMHYELCGKFILTKNHFEVLEDHTGHLGEMEKLSPADIAHKINGLRNSMYYRLVNLQDMNDGQHPDLIREHVAPPSLGPESVFEYHRVGMPQPQTLEFVQGKAYLDGHLLQEVDLQLLLDNARQGHATIRYHQPDDSIEKAEDFFMSLAKVEPHLDAALAGLREAVKQGHVKPEVLKALTNEIFTDSMIRGMGNKKAYQDFLSRPKQGIHIRMDGANFGAVNKRFGFETGNDAIKAMFGAVREALDETVGSKNGKAFRIGGDEGHAFVPSHEDAALFARSLRAKLEAIPPIGGTHHLALSLGWGPTPQHAEAAMIDAKSHAKSTQPGYYSGKLKTHAASRIPGFEGHIPLGQEELNLQPLPSDPLDVVRQVPHILPPSVSLPERLKRPDKADSEPAPS